MTRRISQGESPRLSADSISTLKSWYPNYFLIGENDPIPSGGDAAIRSGVSSHAKSARSSLAPLFELAKEETWAQWAVGA